MAQHEIPWSNAFNSLPVPTSKVGQTDTFIRQTRQAVSERISQEHNLDMDDLATDNQGKHLEGSGRCFITNTAPIDPSDCIETVDTDNGNIHAKDFVNGRQYFNPETRKFYVYVNDYTYLDSKSVSHTVTGFLETRSSLNETATALFVGACSVPNTTVIKDVTLESFALVTGMKLSILFSNSSCDAAMFSVNGGTASAMRFADLPTTTTTWGANALLDLMYDGIYWQIVGISDFTSHLRPSLNCDITGKSSATTVGLCSVSAITLEKTVKLLGFVLETGSKATVQFTNGAVASATLNINGTGAKPMYYSGALITATTWSAGDILDIMYDGTNYQVLNIIKQSSGNAPQISLAYRTKKNKVVLTSPSSSWTVPDNVYQIGVIAVGGGGGSGYAARYSNGARVTGGGGGGTLISDILKTYLDVTPGQSIAYGCGAGGAVGSDGNQTTFGTITAGGGFKGGDAYLDGYVASGGSGGAGSDTLGGQAGQTNTSNAEAYSSTFPVLGGGSSKIGTKANYGGGGASDQAGGDGVIIVEYETLIV